MLFNFLDFINFPHFLKVRNKVSYLLELLFRENFYEALLLIHYG